MNFIRTYTRYAVVLSSITSGVSKTKVSIEEPEDSELAYIDSQLMKFEEYTNHLDGKHNAVKKRRLQYEEKMVNIGHFEVDADGQMRRLTEENSPLADDLKAIEIELDALITEEQLFEDLVGYFKDESDALKVRRVLIGLTDEMLMEEVHRRNLGLSAGKEKHGRLRGREPEIDKPQSPKTSISIERNGDFGGHVVCGERTFVGMEKGSDGFCYRFFYVPDSGENAKKMQIGPILTGQEAEDADAGKIVKIDVYPSAIDYAKSLPAKPAKPVIPRLDLSKIPKSFNIVGDTFKLTNYNSRTENREGRSVEILATGVEAEDDDTPSKTVNDGIMIQIEGIDEPVTVDQKWAQRHLTK